MTSPSAPRVKTFSGTNSPTSAKSAKNASLRGEEATKVVPAPCDARAPRTDGADRDDGGDIEVEWVVASGMARDGSCRESRVSCPDNA